MGKILFEGAMHAARHKAIKYMVDKGQFDKFHAAVKKMKPADLRKEIFDRNYNSSRTYGDFSLAVSTTNSITAFNGYVSWDLDAARYSISVDFATDVLLPVYRQIGHNASLEVLQRELPHLVTSDYSAIATALVSAFSLKKHGQYSFYVAEVVVSSLDPEKIFENGQELYAEIKRLATSTDAPLIMAAVQKVALATALDEQLRSATALDSKRISPDVKGAYETLLAKLSVAKAEADAIISDLTKRRELQHVMKFVLDKDEVVLPTTGL